MIGGIVLAAGEGRRFGAVKQLAELEGRPLLEHALMAMAAVRAIERVVLVLGAHAEEIRAAVGTGGAEVVLAPDWAEGPTHSLRAGLAALPEAEAVIVTLGDQPRLTPQVIARFAAAEGTCRAAYAGQPGHPVRLTAAVARRLRERPPPGGARALLRSHPLIEVGHLCRFGDVDTPAQLEALR